MMFVLNKERHIGIPSMYDRAMQVLFCMALEPIPDFIVKLMVVLVVSRLKKQDRTIRNMVYVHELFPKLLTYNLKDDKIFYANMGFSSITAYFIL